MVRGAFASARFSAGCLFLAAFSYGSFGQMVSIPSGSKGPQAKTREELDAFGLIYEAINNRAGIAAAESFLRAHPHSDFVEYACMAAMRSYDESGDWDGAHRMAKETLRSNPENVDALLTLSRLLIDPGHESAQTLTQARTFAESGMAHLKSMSIPASANSKQWIQTKKAFLAQGSYVLGWVAFRERNTSEAVRKLRTAIEFDPQGEYFYRLAVITAAHGDLQAALKLAVKARDMGPARVSNLASLEIKTLAGQLHREP